MEDASCRATAAGKACWQLKDPTLIFDRLTNRLLISEAAALGSFCGAGVCLAGTRGAGLRVSHGRQRISMVGVCGRGRDRGRGWRRWRWRELAARSMHSTTLLAAAVSQSATGGEASAAVTAFAACCHRLN